MRRISKKNRESYFKKMKKALEEIGATTAGCSSIFNTFELKTKGGKLTLSLPGAEDHIFTYTLYSKFEDVKKAKSLGLYGLNPYSGKYNYHYLGSDNKPKEVVNHIINDLKTLL